ncbi:MAG: hypothetical protein EOO72_05860, partial [Myxococcaceae bacterium]
MARTGPRSPRCPDCNAPFALKPGQTHYTCGYCGIAFDLGAAQTKPPVSLPPGPQGKPPSSAPVIVVLAGVMVLLMSTAAVFIMKA